MWPVVALCMYIQARTMARGFRCKANVSLQCWESSCSNALSNCLEVIISSVELNASELWELLSENLLGGVKHNVATIAFADASQDHHMVDFVELAILCQTIAQIDADGLIDLACLLFLLFVLHCLLDELQDFCMVFVRDCAHVCVWIFHVIRHFHTTLACKFCGSTLPKVHVRETGVRTLGPRISWCSRVQIKSDVAEFINPTNEIAIGIR